MYRRLIRESKWEVLFVTKLKGFTKIELLIVLCILTVLFIVYVDMTRNFKGPIGRTIPKTSPREENRIFHPSGLSFVAPPNWDSNLNMEYHQEVSRLSVVPREGISRRYQRANFRCKLIDPPQTEQISDSVRVEFQGFPAYERMYVLRTDTFDAPAFSVYDLFINRDGEWWRVSYEIADEMTELPLIMREYIKTIRFPPKADQESDS
ncbi:hypothetical protein [uncultured Gimesia sp.]|uniref:hypothetical protein n=1 Tax=uncultured Gimesia sp. TaxID=1678688 RepID=UPI0030D98492|tara:strand:+ start:40627 stop:41247 length:621 start_codon:yes stop_codon:yes gene_type:complete